MRLSTAIASAAVLIALPRPGRRAKLADPPANLSYRSRLAPRSTPSASRYSSKSASRSARPLCSRTGPAPAVRSAWRRSPRPTLTATRCCSIPRSRPSCRRRMPSCRTHACPLSANSGHRPPSLDHLVCGQKNPIWYSDAKRLGGLEIDY